MPGEGLIPSIHETLDELDDCVRVGGGSAELTLSKRKLQEADFWAKMAASVEQERGQLGARDAITGSGR